MNNIIANYMNNIIANYKNYIGYSATIISIISFIPVILNIAKTKKTNNFPFRTIFLALLGNSLFLLNGLLTSNNVMIFMGIVFVLLYSYILHIKLVMFKK
tara:strand:+ start:810 stop:1109 length:300 start_codon:yes stop_codon:yes gene_type:complete